MRFTHLLFGRAIVLSFILACLGADIVLVDDKAPPARMRIAPVRFNESDAKEVDLPPCGEGGSVSLDFDGVPTVSVEYQEWANGKRVMDGPSQSHMRLDGPGRLAFSFGLIKDEDGKPLFQVITAESGIVHKGKTTWRTTPSGRSETAKVIKVARIAKAVDLKEDESLALWAILGFENTEQAKGKAITLEEGPKHAKWAILIKLSWKKQ